MEAKHLYRAETGKDRIRLPYEKIPSVTEDYINWLEHKVSEQYYTALLKEELEHNPDEWCSKGKWGDCDCKDICERGLKK